MTKYIFSLALFILSIIALQAQVGSIHGKVYVEGNPTEYAQVVLEDINIGTTTSMDGTWQLNDIPYGNYKLVISFLGYRDVEEQIRIDKENNHLNIDVDLTESSIEIDQVVITGTKTFKRQTNSPVIVSVMNNESINNVQACTLSEGLKFQTGLRVETDCQTCNYTQLRMNGLSGGYSQILINGRPIFSPLTGLYGLEQIPANMIDRIEVVRGGGSSLYGSSAIGGTVNVITSQPTKNSYSAEYSYQNIDGQTDDHTINGNASLISTSRKSGLSTFINHRSRDFYDANGDNFSEMPKIENNAVGINLFHRPTENQKLELNASYVNEYRYGGEMIDDREAHLAQQSEERTHDVWMASMDYQNNFNDDHSSFITYLAWQHTDRAHYTGISPDQGTEEYEAFIADPPYGSSDVQTFNIGTQLNHKVYIGERSNIITVGAEYVYDDVFDEIPAYHYKTDQTTKNFGSFLQSDWQLISNLTLLTGVRMDLHNLVEKPIFSPRASLLYKYLDNTQFRVSYGKGFRAPQAFDTDLHIAFAGGGISRVILSPDLTYEKSDSYSASINFDKPTDQWVAGFTLESFYNHLLDAFYLQPIGADDFGELFEKNNGPGATVQGVTVEVRANYDQKVQVEGGITFQSSEYEQKVQYIDEIPGIKTFTRTPDNYGFAVLTLMPNRNFKANLNYVYTGSMILPHFAGAPNQTVDEMVESSPFLELSTKVSYTLPVSSLSTNVEIYAGVKNILNSYQKNFDIGKNRDSNFVYGPAQPRSYFVGLKIRGL